MKRLLEHLNYFVYDSELMYYDLSESEAKGILDYIEKQQTKINELKDSLSQVLDYADDETISRDDEDYKYFFETLDKAYKLLKDE